MEASRRAERNKEINYSAQQEITIATACQCFLRTFFVDVLVKDNCID